MQTPLVAHPCKKLQRRGPAAGHVQPRKPPAQAYKHNATWFAFNVCRKKVPIACSRSAILISPHQLYLRVVPNAQANEIGGVGRGKQMKQWGEERKGNGVCLPALAHDARLRRGGEQTGSGTSVPAAARHGIVCSV